jgi:hypothetical protein
MKKTSWLWRLDLAAPHQNLSLRKMRCRIMKLGWQAVVFIGE